MRPQKEKRAWLEPTPSLRIVGKCDELDEAEKFFPPSEKWDWAMEAANFEGRVYRLPRPLRLYYFWLVKSTLSDANYSLPAKLAV